MTLQIHNNLIEKSKNPNIPIKLPTLDSAEFWAAIEPVAIVKAKLPLATVAGYTRQFALKGELEKAQKVFSSLYWVYEDAAIRAVRRYCYNPLNTFVNKSPQLIEELAQDVWLKVFQDLTNPDPTYVSTYTKSFENKFYNDARSIARQQGIEEGYSAKSNRVLSEQKISLDQPLHSNSDGNEAEGLALSDLLGATDSGFEVINLLAALAKRLNSEQKQITQMMLNGNSQNAIAKELHMAEKTLKRKVLELRNIIQEELSP